MNKKNPKVLESQYWTERMRLYENAKGAQGTEQGVFRVG